MVFLDFDGTITRRDATDAILETYADPQWLQIEEAWRTGRIGSRDCLAGQMALVAATREEIDALLDDIEIDPGLISLLEACTVHGVTVYIISDGFDYCIDRILSRPSLNLAPYLTGVQIVSSHLESNGTQWKVRSTSSSPPCVHGCCTCKLAAMERLNDAGGPTIFIGDGLSDKYAAAHADLVFAKDALATYCEEQTISYTPYDNLATIARQLDHLLQSQTAFKKVSPTL